MQSEVFQLIELMKDRTSIVITHRLSTIQHADKIIVLKDGEIKESGTHKDLLSLGGIYHNLVRFPDSMSIPCSTRVEVWFSVVSFPIERIEFLSCCCGYFTVHTCFFKNRYNVCYMNGTHNHNKI